MGDGHLGSVEGGFAVCPSGFAVLLPIKRERTRACVPNSVHLLIMITHCILPSCLSDN